MMAMTDILTILNILNLLGIISMYKAESNQAFTLGAARTFCLNTINIAAMLSVWPRSFSRLPLEGNICTGETALGFACFELTDLLIFLLGLCFGSFGGMLAARIPLGEAITGRSHCTRCNQTLEPLELIPVLSFLAQRGKCRHCGEKISPAYVIVELSTAVSFVFLYRCFGLGLQGILHMIVGFHLCVLAGTDIMHGLLPNKILLSASGFAIILRMSQAWSSQTWASLIDGFWGALVGFGLLFAVAFVRPGAMGGGDVKMAGAIGFYLGFPAVLPGLALGFAVSAVYCIPLLLLGRLKKTDTIPLGVFLSFGTIVTVIAWHI